MSTFRPVTLRFFRNLHGVLLCPPQHPTTFNSPPLSLLFSFSSSLSTTTLTQTDALRQRNCHSHNSNVTVKNIYVNEDEASPANDVCSNCSNSWSGRTTVKAQPPGESVASPTTSPTSYTACNSYDCFLKGVCLGFSASTGLFD